MENERLDLGTPALKARHKSSVTLCFSPAACDVIDQHMGQKFTTPPTKEQENDLLTPEAPSIAFPLANPPVAPEPEVRSKGLSDNCQHFHTCIIIFFIS